MKRIESPSLHWAAACGVNQFAQCVERFMAQPITMADLIADNLQERCAVAVPWQQIDSLLKEAKVLRAKHGEGVVLGAGPDDFSLDDLIVQLEGILETAAPIRAAGKVGRKAA